MNKIWKKRIIGLGALVGLLWSMSVTAGKLAIVIDDIGYRGAEDQAILALPQAVAVAIIPSAPYASARAKQAYAQQRDILIHLPMQPKGNAAIESGALRLGMNAEQVDGLIRAARQAVPYAIGLNNHMGSAATADKPLMQLLMKALAREQLFFLDSKTIGSSVAYQTAKAFGVRALERHIFLDDSDKLADVARQFQQAVALARKNGVAIMIGHPRKNSVSVLQQGLANLPQDVQLVSMSSLWRAEQLSPSKPFILQFIGATTSEAPFKYVPFLRGIPQE